MLHCFNEGDQFPSKSISTLVALGTSLREVSVSVHLVSIHLVTITIIGRWLSGPHLIVWFGIHLVTITIKSQWLSAPHWIV